jgi:hypothetical protein
MESKFRKICDTRYDTDKDVVESLHSLSTFFQDNTLKNRRNLRSQIELKTLDLHKVKYFFDVTSLKLH